MSEEYWEEEYNSAQYEISDLNTEISDLYNKIKELEKQNEELKEKLDMHIETSMLHSQRAKELEKQNAELKESNCQLQKDKEYLIYELNRVNSNKIQLGKY